MSSGMTVKKSTILVVDDDHRVLAMIQRIMELEDFRVIRADSGRAALEMFASEAPDIVLLDITMPGMDGYEVLRRIREFSQVPVVMVTAKNEVEERVQGLDVGADDYITKPFSVQELTARVRAVLRRSTLWDERLEPDFRCDELAIDFTQCRATLAGQEVSLTATEYKLLTYLARNAGRLLTPDQILEKVWGSEYVGESHLLQVNIARLRTKLKDDARNPKYIATRPTIGYMMMKNP